MVKVLFIRHGNICRSVMAEFILKDMVRKAGREDEFEAASRATRIRSALSTTEPDSFSVRGCEFFASPAFLLSSEPGRA